MPSISRRGNCLDDDVAGSFFQLLKRERIKRRIYGPREGARRDVFNYDEFPMFAKQPAYRRIPRRAIRCIGRQRDRLAAIGWYLRARGV